MARKQTSIDVQGFETTFLVQKTSRLQPIISGSGYYTNMKHLKNGTSFPNRFVSSFNSQVNPTILPGFTGGGTGGPVVETSYVLSELDEPIITEDDNNLIIE